MFEQELFSTTYGIALIATEAEIWDVGESDLTLLLHDYY